jgi:hypothetical protein
LNPTDGNTKKIKMKEKMCMESSYVMQLVEKIPNHACEGLREKSYVMQLVSHTNLLGFLR